MATPLHVAHSLSPLLAGVLVASVWQGLLVTAGVAFALRGLREVSPAGRTAVWTAVLVLLLLLPVWAVLVPHGGTSGNRALHVGQEWSVALMAVWAVCSAWRGLALVGSAFRVWRLAGRAVPVAVENPLAKLLAGPRQATLCVSTEVDRPSVVGLVSPRVLLPAGLLETLSTTELEHVVRHEMEHLRRWDDWLNLLQQVGLVLLPLNPALVWLDRQLCRERELACDDGVLRATCAGNAYAACLVKLAEESLRRKGLSLALSALGSRLEARAGESELVGRVRRILAGPERVAGIGQSWWSVGTLAVAALVAAGLLARSPAWVWFDAGPEMTALRAESVAAGGLSRRAVAIAARLPEVDPWRPPAAMLTKAVMQRPALSRLRPVAAVATSRRKTRLSVVQVKAAVELHAPAMLPVRPLLASESGIPREATGLRPGVRPSARVVVTEFEVSQPELTNAVFSQAGVVFTYAAVPWRGGWLLVQL